MVNGWTHAGLVFKNLNGVHFEGESSDWYKHGLIQNSVHSIGMQFHRKKFPRCIFRNGKNKWHSAWRETNLQEKYRGAGERSCRIKEAAIKWKVGR